MPDTVRTIAYLLASEFQDGQAAGSINPQDMRDFIVTVQALTNPQVTQNIQTTTSYTLAITDAGGMVTVNCTSANSLLVPTNASVAIPVGTVIPVLVLKATVTTISAVTPATTTLAYASTASTITPRAQYSIVNLFKQAADFWIVSGDIT